MGRSALSPLGAVGRGLLAGFAGLVAGSRSRPATFAGALGLTAGVWGGSRAVMTAMRLAPPPWQDPAKMLAMDIGFHLVYGAAGAAAFRVLS